MSVVYDNRINNATLTALSTSSRTVYIEELKDNRKTKACKKYLSFYSTRYNQPIEGHTGSKG